MTILAVVVLVAVAPALAVRRHWVYLWQVQLESQCPETLLFLAFSSSFGSGFKICVQSLRTIFVENTTNLESYNLLLKI